MYTKQDNIYIDKKKMRKEKQIESKPISHRSEIALE